MQNQAKVILRKNIKKVVQQMSLENKLQQSNLVMQKLMGMSEFKSSKRFSLYLSTEMEVETIPLLKIMFQQNKEIFVPTYSGSEMKLLKLFSVEDYEALPMTKWKIKQPNPDDVNRENPMMTDRLDVIIMPGVAFTINGDRLGHGMGYYDKYLQEYFNRYPNDHQHQTQLIGLGFREQIIDDLPTEASHDVKLDIVLSA